MLDEFSCIENDERLSKFTSKIRKKIKKHSKEMEDFLKHEAYQEQELGTSTTFLLLDDESNRVMAYISLCNDSIGLEMQERKDEGITYGSAPALKIARLAVDSAYTGKGIGRYLVRFAAYKAQLIRGHSGVFFITLDCYAHRVSFYESIGFVKNLIQPVALPYDTPISMRVGVDSYLEAVAQPNYKIP